MNNNSPIFLEARTDYGLWHYGKPDESVGPKPVGRGQVLAAPLQMMSENALQQAKIHKKQMLIGQISTLCPRANKNISCEGFTQGCAFVYPTIIVKLYLERG